MSGTVLDAGMWQRPKQMWASPWGAAVVAEVTAGWGKVLREDSPGRLP